MKDEIVNATMKIGKSLIKSIKPSKELADKLLEKFEEIAKYIK